MKIIAIALALCVSSCVTSSDIRAIADAQEKYEVATQVALEKIQSKTATKEDIKEAKEELKDASEDFSEAVEAVAKVVEQRTADTITGLPESAEGGLVGILAALAVNYYRSRTRRRDLDEVLSSSKTDKTA